MSFIIELIRDHREVYCTLGKMMVGQHRLETMERPWIPNPDGGKSGKRFESCIAAGSYRLVAHRSDKYPLAWALTNPALDVYYQPNDVPKGREKQGRVAILIHPANVWYELLGCIAPGRSRSKQQGIWGVWSSREAMNLIKTVIGNKLDVTLTIAWAEGLQPKEA